MTVWGTFYESVTFGMPRIEDVTHFPAGKPRPADGSFSFCMIIGEKEPASKRKQEKSSS